MMDRELMLPVLISILDRLAHSGVRSLKLERCEWEIKSKNPVGMIATTTMVLKEDNEKFKVLFNIQSEKWLMDQSVTTDD